MFKEMLLIIILLHHKIEITKSDLTMVHNIKNSFTFSQHIKVRNPDS